MTATSYDARGVPTYLETNAPAFGTDLSEVADFAGIVGNRIVGTAAERAAFSTLWPGFSGGPWDGLEFEETDTGVLYKRVSGAWKAWESGWISYTPTFSGFAIGSGGSASAVTEYRYEAGSVRVRFRYVFGTSGATFPTTPKISLPVNAAALAHNYMAYLAGGDMWDTSAEDQRLLIVVADQNSVSTVRLTHQTFTAPGYAYPTPTVPWTWAAGDAMQGEFTYRPA